MAANLGSKELALSHGPAVLSLKFSSNEFLSFSFSFEGLFQWSEIVLVYWNKIFMMLVSNLLSWILSIIDLDCMLKVGFLNVSEHSNWLTVSAKFTKMIDLGLNMWLVSSRLTRILNEFNTFLFNFWFFVLNFYVLDKLEVNMSFVLKINVLFWFSLELTPRHLRFLRSPNNDTLSVLRFLICLNFDSWRLVDGN